MWLVGLGVVAGVGALGESEIAPPSEAPSLAVVARPSPATIDTPEPIAGVIELQEPAAAGSVVTTPDLVIRGYLRERGGPVRVLLESSGGKPMLTRTLSPSPWFVVNLPLSNPRPGGELTVQVIAYDLDGIPIDVVRRRVVIGAIAEREIGEDGLMGEIVFPDP